MFYSLPQFKRDAKELARILSRYFPETNSIFGVPQGGVPLAVELSHLLGWELIGDRVSLDSSTIIVDDVCDSGTTRARFLENPFFVLHYKKGCDPQPTGQLYEVPKETWIEYWWEMGEGSTSATDIITRTFQYIGEDPKRNGLLDTPKRVLKTWDYLYKGYKEDPLKHIKLFDMAEYDQMVLLKNIEIYSMCEHHMLPFFGKAHVAYIPHKGGHVIGISKLARLIEVYARRLQIQERIGEQVTSILMEQLHPVGAACIIEADHLCMRMRGVEKQNSVMVTSSLKGIFLDNTDEGRAARAELMGLIK